MAVPAKFLNQLLSKKESIVNNAPKRPRISVTDSFTLPSNSSYASTSKSTNTKICAFNVSGTVAPVATVIKKTFEKVQVIDNNLLLMQEYMTAPDPNIGIEKSQMADNLQEPRLLEDNCSEVEPPLKENNNDIVALDDEDDSRQASALAAELGLIVYTPKSRSPDLIAAEEQKRLLGSKGKIFTRSQANKGLISNDSTFVTPSSSTRSALKRSFEHQDENDITASPISSRSKRVSKGSNFGVPVKIPNLPVNFNQLLESLDFQPGRKQADQQFGQLNIKGYDLYSLRIRQYVNDIIIDHYLQLVSKRSLEVEGYRKTFALATFFYTMLNNGQSNQKLISWIKADLFDYDVIVLPINQDSHWFLFVADFDNKNYFIYDSLYDGNYTSELKRIANFLKAYCASRGREINWNEWSDAPTEEQLGPTQKNGVDCGIFLCQYAEHLSRRATLDFTQSGMQNYRKRMLYELLTGELLDPSL